MPNETIIISDADIMALHDKIQLVQNVAKRKLLQAKLDAIIHDAAFQFSTTIKPNNDANSN
jgi:hypothetical protein